MGLLRHRVTSFAEPLPALMASLAAAVVVLLGSLTASFTDPGVAPVLVTVAAVGVLAAVLASTSRHALQPLPVRATPSGVTGAVSSATAYWCTVDAPSCPQRPRAPGRH
jgi:hypothetical protein